MSFNGTEGALIKIGPASTLTATFRSNYSSQNKGYFYGKNKLNTILAQTDCQGIRIYFGEDSSGLLTLVIVGADSNEDDMTSYILDTGTACPISCGANNALNS